MLTDIVLTILYDLVVVLAQNYTHMFMHFIKFMHSL